MAAVRGRVNAQFVALVADNAAALKRIYPSLIPTMTLLGSVGDVAMPDTEPTPGVMALACTQLAAWLVDRQMNPPPIHICCRLLVFMAKGAMNPKKGSEIPVTALLKMPKGPVVDLMSDKPVNSLNTTSSPMIGVPIVSRAV